MQSEIPFRIALVVVILLTMAVKRGVRIVHGDKPLEEKFGRNDLCPCGSGKVLRRCCMTTGRF